MCCGFFGGGGEDGTSSTTEHTAAVILVSPDDFCGEEVEAVDMADITEASDRCTSGISSSSFLSEYNNRDGNNEIRILKSNNDEIRQRRNQYPEIKIQKAEIKEQKSVKSICCAYSLYRITACTLKNFRRFVYLYRNISPCF